MQLAARHELVVGGVDRFLPALLLTLFRHERILSCLIHTPMYPKKSLNCGVATFSWRLDIWIRHSGGQGLVRDELAWRFFARPEYLPCPLEQSFFSMHCSLFPHAKPRGAESNQVGSDSFRIITRRLFVPPAGPFPCVILLVGRCDRFLPGACRPHECALTEKKNRILTS